MTRASFLLHVRLLSLGFLAIALFVFTGALIRFPWRHFLEPRDVMMPVEGVRRVDVRSTWHAPRGGRRHEGVDIFAPAGTPVVAAASGTIIKVGHDELGGRVVTVLGGGPALYYYAHLSSWAPGLRPGMAVEPGALLGTVGNTGNARGTPPHLHFGIYRVGFFSVEAIDPVPWLETKQAMHRPRPPLVHVPERTQAKKRLPAVTPSRP